MKIHIFGCNALNCALYLEFNEHYSITIDVTLLYRKKSNKFDKMLI